MYCFGNGTYRMDLVLISDTLRMINKAGGKFIQTQQHIWLLWSFINVDKPTTTTTTTNNETNAGRDGGGIEERRPKTDIDRGCGRGMIAASQTTGGSNESLCEDWHKNKQISNVVLSLSCHLSDSLVKTLLSWETLVPDASFDCQNTYVIVMLYKYKLSSTTIYLHRIGGIINWVAISNYIAMYSIKIGVLFWL